MHSQIIPVILAGGSGERLWPLSTPDMPKQFLSFDASALSLFQHSLTRVENRELFAAPIIVCNDRHRFIAAEQLQMLGIQEATLLVEPLARNTAPAVAFAALHAAPDAVLLVLPSDHKIDKASAFLAAVQQGMAAAMAGRIVTFAVTPDGPNTNYGYIKQGAALSDYPHIHAIERFTEKPDLAQATAYLAEGGYGWNSGIFLMRADRLLSELAVHAPALLDHCRMAYAAHVVDLGFIRPAAEAMASCPSISIDYALMEKTALGAVIPVEMGWSDLGSWTSIAGMYPADDERNHVYGPVAMLETQGCHIQSDGPLVAAIGLREMSVIVANDTVLVGPRERMVEVKALQQRMQDDAVTPRASQAVTYRPWGSFQLIDRGAHHQVKKLYLKPGGKISLQSHTHRAEHWVVVEGRATVTNGEAVSVLEQNQSTFIPAGVVHRLENRETMPLVVIETQTGAQLREEDITRFEDAYNRETNASK